MERKNLIVKLILSVLLVALSTAMLAGLFGGDRLYHITDRGAVQTAVVSISGAM